MIVCVASKAVSRFRHTDILPRRSTQRTAAAAAQCTSAPRVPCLWSRSFPRRRPPRRLLRRRNAPEPHLSSSSAHLVSPPHPHPAAVHPPDGIAMSRRLFLSSPLTRASHITRPATIRSPFLVAPFSSSSSSASTSTSSIPSAMEDTKPRFSAGTDEASAQAALAPLLQASSPSSSGGGAAGSGRWALVKDGEALERSF